MSGYVFDQYMLVLIVSLATFMVGFVVYIIFYYMFHKLYGSKVRSISRLKEEIVMCGLEYSEEVLSAPATKIFSDVMKRSLRGVHNILTKELGTRVLNDWFAWMLIMLTLIIVLAMFMR